MRIAKPWMIWILFLMVAGLVACGDSDTTNVDGDVDQPADGDNDEPDGDEPDGDEPDVCAVFADVPMDEPDLEQKKFALTMFHFNVQYVAGGLETTWDGESMPMCGSLCVGWTDEKVQDWIIVETFEPVLDFYIAHPGWRVTFEMQSMMLEAMHERHPEILSKLRDAAKSGQVEVVSFHWSDQLFVAFPERDLHRSIAITKQLFADYDVPLSKVVFNQEGQAGEGKHALMADECYGISVFPKNLYRYVRFEEAVWPYYTDKGVDVVVGPIGVDPDSGIEVNWPFFDDGELLMVPEDPYFAFLGGHDPERLVEYEAKLTALEEDGFKITGIADYVRHLKAQEIEQPQLPPVIDGTWQPTSTDSVLRWMGGRSLAPYNNHERDNLIRSGNYRVSTELAAAEALLAAAETAALDSATAQTDLDQAARHLLMSMVSDATGITPWHGEFNYGVDNNAAALALIEGVQADLLTALDWPHALIDLEAGTAERLDDIPLPEAPDAAEAPLAVTVDAPSRTATLDWFTYDDTLYEAQLTFGPSSDPTGKEAENAKVTLSFPRSEDLIAYSPALMDGTLVEYAFSDFTFQKPEIYLPLANGLIALGDDTWLIKDCRQVHLAPRIGVTADEPVVQLIDETADPENGDFWRVYVFYGSGDEALAQARRLNSHPVVYK